MAEGSLKEAGPQPARDAVWLEEASLPLPNLDLRLDAEVRRIATELLQEGKRAADGTWTWQGPTGYGTPGFPFKYRRLPPHLYDGTSGVALFFAAFSRAYPDDDLSEVALGALKPLRDFLRKRVEGAEVVADQGLPLGGFVGIGSFIYTFLQVGNLLDRPRWVDEAHDLTSLITLERIRSDRRSRVQTGCAGTILALLALNEKRGQPNLKGHTPLDLAVACGEHLLESRQAFESGGPRVWLLAAGKPPLAGFCYGASGAIYALTQLYRATKREEFLAAAQEGARFIDSLWVQEQGSWRDVRPYFEAQYEVPKQGWQDWWSTETLSPLIKRQDGPAEFEDRFPRMWCHGSSGIALGRLAALSIEDTPSIRAQIEKVLDNACEMWRSGEFEVTRVNDLCCGHGGHVELLHSAYLKLGVPEYQVGAYRLVERLLRFRQDSGSYRLSATRGRDVFAPSLFQGLAGLGYTFLRLLFPEQIPCVLTLAP